MDLRGGARALRLEGPAGGGGAGAEAPVAGQDADVLRRVIHGRRSVRRYDGRVLSRERVRELVDLATRAPSNFNSQPWRFVVVDQSEPRLQIVEAVEELLAQAREGEASSELFHTLEHIAAWLYPVRESPVLVLAFYRPNPEAVARSLAEIPGAGTIMDYNPNLLSLGMALQNLLLGAHAHGLGACTLAGPVPFLRGWINAFLDLPERLELAAVVAVGHPSGGQPAASPRRAVSRVLTFVETLEGKPRLSP